MSVVKLRLVVFLGGYLLSSQLGASQASWIEWEDASIKVNPVHPQLSGDEYSVDLLIEQGRELFTTKFSRIDGAGRPASTGDSKPTSREPVASHFFSRTSGPDATSCHACHNEPQVGGSGDFVANVFVGAHFADEPSVSIAPEHTNERNTIGIFGAGVIEMLALEMTEELQMLRDNTIHKVMESSRPISVRLVTKGIDFGILTVRDDTTLDFSNVSGIDYDLVVRPFGVKGIAASLREFTIAALNQHHGLQAVERFGWERTGTEDFDKDGVKDEFSIGQVSALVLFQANLPVPQRSRELAASPEVKRGEKVFSEIGCNACHIEELPLKRKYFVEPNPYNRPGSVRPGSLETIRIDLKSFSPEGGVVRAYTDLKRHNLCDDEISYFCNESIKQDNVDTRLFLTSKLWDLATSAPYGHRGDLGTISEAILAHGGEARKERDLFVGLSTKDKRWLIAFLKSLGSQKPGKIETSFLGR